MIGKLQYLALPPGDGEGNIVISPWAGPIKSSRKEAAGRAFNDLVLSLQKVALDDDDDNSSESSDDDSPDDDTNVMSYLTFDDKYVRTADPSNWKDQDHYRILGLHQLRYKATAHQVKRAHRAAVLRHHPDKRNVADKDHDYFSCITIAFEQLGHKRTRRAYDSVDPEFDSHVPGQCKDNPAKFYKSFSRVFERNARWSSKGVAPLLGDECMLRDDVEGFYAFWFNFNSWREFSYLDEEEKDKSHDRYDRRYIDKQNKAERQRMKKEENARIRRLVDNAFASDPRIKKFKEEDTNAKEELKKQKREAVEEAARQRELQRVEEERREEERLKVERAAEAEKKRQREIDKKKLKMLRKTLRDNVKTRGYFSETPAQAAHNLYDLEQLCERLDVRQLQELNDQMLSGGDAARTAYLEAVAQYKDVVAAEESKLLIAQSSSKKKKAEKESGSAGSMTSTQLESLVKAVKFYPPGTQSRWDAVAIYINDHNSDSAPVSAKQCICTAKGLQQSSVSLKKDANERAFDRYSNNVKGVDSGSMVEPLVQADFAAKDAQIWDNDEQKLLEQALRTYPNGTDERWEKIASAVPGRTKKQVMLRYKELVEMIKAKKAALPKGGKK